MEKTLRVVQLRDDMYDPYYWVRRRAGILGLYSIGARPKVPCRCTRNAAHLPRSPLAVVH